MSRVYSQRYRKKVVMIFSNELEWFLVVHKDILEIKKAAYKNDMIPLLELKDVINEEEIDKQENEKVVLMYKHKNKIRDD